MVIVGAGIAGLSTGCYARLNGYRTTILEAHNIPGDLQPQGHLLDTNRAYSQITMYQGLGGSTTVPQPGAQRRPQPDREYGSCPRVGSRL